jgi:hypothetical protein
MGHAWHRQHLASGKTMLVTVVVAHFIFEHSMSIPNSATVGEYRDLLDFAALGTWDNLEG